MRVRYLDASNPDLLLEDKATFKHQGLLDHRQDRNVAVLTDWWEHVHDLAYSHAFDLDPFMNERHVNNLFAKLCRR